MQLDDTNFESHSRFFELKMKYKNYNQVQPALK